MRRHTTGLIVTLALDLLAAPAAAQAQQPGRVARIGVLTLAVAPSTPLDEAFRQELRDYGYMEGNNVAFEYRYAEGRADRLPALAAELVRLKVAVIVTESNVAALAAKRATQTIPIVMAIAGDPVEAGVVGSLARPGGNVTGLTLMHPELSGKRLQLLQEAAPKIARVAVIWNPTDPGAADFLRETEAAARSLGLTLRAIEARAPADLAVEQPTRFELVVNLRTAGALGLTIPPSILVRADQMIQ